MTVVEQPGESGLGYAMRRAYLAWQDTQPQLVIEGWSNLLDGLDEPGPGAARLVEPACAAPSPEVAGGLASTFEGDGANHIRVARRPQGGL